MNTEAINTEPLASLQSATTRGVWSILVNFPLSQLGVVASPKMATRLSCGMSPWEGGAQRLSKTLAWWCFPFWHHHAMQERVAWSNVSCHIRVSHAMNIWLCYGFGGMTLVKNLSLIPSFDPKLHSARKPIRLRGAMFSNAFSERQSLGGEAGSISGWIEWSSHVWLKGGGLDEENSQAFIAREEPEETNLFFWGGSSINPMYLVRV